MTRENVIEAGMSYPIPEIIERYAEEQDLPTEAAEEHAREAKKYLLLCALHPDKTYGMRGPIDEFWHTFVTFTRPYADFCDKVAGRFLHHFPNTAPKTREKYSFEPGAQNAASLKIANPDLREAYLEMLTDYEAVFGEPAPKHLWPRPHVGENAGAGFCGCHCRCGCRCIA